MPTATKKAPKRQVTDEHKEALAVGREQSRIVRDYLSAMSDHKPKRGRKRTIESVEKRLTLIEQELGTEDDPLRRLTLMQERMDLEEERVRMQVGTSGEEFTALEEKFCEVAADFSTRKGVTYAAWRAAGVPPQILRKANITR